MKPKELTVRGLIPRGADHDSLYSGKRLPRTEGWTDVRFVDSCSGDLRRGRFRRVGYCDSHAHCRMFVRRVLPRRRIGVHRIRLRVVARVTFPAKSVAWHRALHRVDCSVVWLDGASRERRARVVMQFEYFHDLVNK